MSSVEASGSLCRELGATHRLRIERFTVDSLCYKLTNHDQNMNINGFMALSGSNADKAPEFTKSFVSASGFQAQSVP